MHLRLRCLSLAVGCALGGCAAQPPATVTAPIAPTHAVGNAAVIPPGPQNAGASATPASTSGSDSDRAALLKQAISLGYKKQQRQGSTVYCHTEASLGTRFPKTSCLTEDAMIDTMRDMAATQDYMRTAPGRCVSAGCGSN